VKRFEAQRLVQTETARFNNDSTTDVYKDIGIERWTYVATLDSRTDDTCGGYDGQHFPVGSGPDIPQHPLCRCTSIADLGKAYEPDERIMRDPVTGKNSYIGNISFDKWTQLYKSR